MDRWFLVAATVLAVMGGAWGMRAVHRGVRSRWTVVWMLGVLACQLGFLGMRGQERGSCPLHDPGEILAYLAWAVTLFYLFTGAAYRLSLLGLFSIPLVAVLQLVALPLVSPAPERIPDLSPFHALHSALAVLSYGAFGLAAISGVMFLTLDRQLKDQVLSSGLFRNMPPASLLLVAMQRLLLTGTIMMGAGIIAGMLMPRPPAELASAHFLAAIAIWLCYLLLMAVKLTRGMTGRKLSLSAVGIFVAALLIFTSV